MWRGPRKYILSLCRDAPPVQVKKPGDTRPLYWFTTSGGVTALRYGSYRGTGIAEA